MKQRKEPGTCTFCGRSGVTKQHIFPDWLKKVIPREGQSHYQTLIHTEIDNEDKATYIVPELRSSRGPLLARKVRKVCFDCNSGWMSRIETAAKETVAQMILGKPTSLSTDEQGAVATWAALTSTMAEFTHPGTAAIPPLDRKFLMERNATPANWKVFLGASDAPDFTYRHTGGKLAVNGLNQHAQVANTQITGFKLGSLLVHTVSSTVLETADFKNKMPTRLIEIWPAKTAASWPPADRLDRQDIDALTGSLVTYFDTLVS